MHRITVVDSHTGGEPTRLILSGFPDLGAGDMAARLAHLRQAYEPWRRACVLEPRGSDVLVGALLCEPVSPQATAGVIFFNNTGYLGMCGHALIGLVASLAHMGRIEVGRHEIETPVGPVNAVLHADGSVSVRNVPAYRYRAAVAVEVPELGHLTGDIAWGGNWFFLVDDHGLSLTYDNVDQLVDRSWAIRQALESAGITGADGALIDHIELGADDDGVHRNFVLCPGKAYDRSPCGTGTSAKVACLAAEDRLAPGEIWRQRSITGSEFEASYEHDGAHIVPTIRGRAHMCAEATLLYADGDPFYHGIGE